MIKRFRTRAITGLLIARTTAVVLLGSMLFSCGDGLLQPDVESVLDRPSALPDRSVSSVAAAAATLSLQPVAVGVHDEWSLGTGSGKVAAVLLPHDDNASFVTATGNGLRQTYYFPDVGVEQVPDGATIRSVTVHTRDGRFSGPAAGASHAILLAVPGGGDYVAPAYVPPSGGYADHSFSFAADPVTGEAWDLATLRGWRSGNAAVRRSFGMRHSQGGRTARLTTVYLTIDYEVAEPGPDPPAAAPADFTADAFSHEHIALAWSLVDGAASYEYRVNGNAWVEVGDATTVEVSGLEAGTVYAFEVRARNEGGAGPAAGPVAEATHPEPLPPNKVRLHPVSVGVHDGWILGAGDGKVMAVTSPHDGDASFVTADGAGPRQTFYFPNVTTEQIPDGAVINGVTVVVRDRRSSGTAAASHTITMAVHGGGEHDAPAYSPATVYAAHSHTYTADPETGAPWALATLRNWGSSQAAAPRSFGLRHNSPDRNGRLTTIELLIEFTPGEPGPEPPAAAPGSFSAVTLSHDQIRLSWAEVENATSYEYRIDGGAWVGAEDKTTIGIDGLAAGTLYSFEVRGRNEGGAGPVAGPVTAPTGPEPLPATKVRLYPSAVGVHDGWSVGAGANKVAAVSPPHDGDLSYLTADGAGPRQTFYFPNVTTEQIPAGATINSVTVVVRDRRSSGTAAPSHTITMAVPGDANYNAPAHTPSTAYANHSYTFAADPATGAPWSLATLRNWGSSAAATPRTFGLRHNSEGRNGRLTSIELIVDFTPGDPVPDPPATAPGGLAASALSHERIRLTWTAVAGATSYEFATDGGPWVDAGDVTVLEVGGLQSATTYSFEVRARNAGGPGPAAGPVNATTTSPPSSTQLTLHPVAVGVHDGWLLGAGSNKVSAVTLPHDEDGSFVTADGNGPRQTYYFPNVSAAQIPDGSTINSVTLHTRDRRSSGSSATSHTLIMAVPGPINYDGQAHTPPTTYADHSRTFATDPATGAAWELFTIRNWGSSNAATPRSFGLRHNNTSRNGRLTSIHLVIDFTSGVPITEPPADPPGSFAASTQSNESVRLSWSAVEGAQRYEYRIDGGPFIDVGNVTSWAVTGLQPNTTYSFEVRAANSAGSGPIAGPVSTTTHENPPATTTLTLQPAAIGVHDGWQLGAGSSKLAAVLLPHDDDNSYLTIDGNGPRQTFYFPNVTPAQIPDGATINSVTLHTRDGRSSGTNANSHTLIMSVPGPINYDGQAYTPPLNSYADHSRTFTIDPATGTSWNLATLRNWSSGSAATPRSFGLRHNNSGRTGRVTSIYLVIDFTPDVPDTEPPGAAPANLTATAESYSTVRLSWLPVDGARSYEYRVAGGPFVDVGNVSATVVTDLAPSTTYSFEIRGRNDVGPGPIAGPAFATTHNFPTDPDGAVLWIWSGGQKPNGAVVRTRLTGASGDVRLQISTSSSFSSHTETASTFTGSNDVATFDLSDLAPATRYYYRAMVAGAIDTLQSGSFTTLPTVGTAYSFKFAVGSCQDTGSNREVYEHVRAQNPLFWLHQGDIHYRDITTNSIDLFRAAYDELHAQWRQAALYRSTSLVYMWDDHDGGGGNDGDRTGAAWPATRAAYRENVPSHPLVEGAGAAVYYSFVVGRVRFIVSDLRSERSPKSQVDDASKTMLGPVQKQHIKNELALAKANGEFVVWVSSVPWIAAKEAGADHWGGFDTERQEIADYIADLQIGDRIVMLAGDMHATAIDTGENNTWGGFPVFHTGPIDRSSNTKGGPYTHGPFTTGSVGGQFGLVTVVDNGGPSIQLKLDGRRNGSAIDGAQYEFTLSLD